MEITEFHRHEALHTSRVVADLFDREVLNHSAVKADRRLREAAEKVQHALEDFYQALGAATLT